MRELVVFVMMILPFLFWSCSNKAVRQIQESDLETGLVGFYRFNGNAKDMSGNENDATVSGASPVEDRFGKKRSAYEFDGRNDYINLNITQLPTFSVSLWFKGESGALISTHENADNTNNFFLQLNAYGCSIAVRGIDGFWVNDMCAGRSNDYNDGNWHFLTFTSNDGIHKLYVDGELKATLSGNSLTDNRPYILGRREAQGNYRAFYSGRMDDVRIYNRELKDTEIKILQTVK